MPFNRPFRAASLSCLLLASAFGLSAPLDPNLHPCVDDDRDVDGIADVLDNCPGVANPEQGDCDADGTGDACESVTIASGDLGGFAGGAASGTLVGVGPTLWPVTVSLRVIGDLAAPGTSVSLSLAGVEVATGLFSVGGSACPTGSDQAPDQATLTLSAQEWNALAALADAGVMPVSVAGNLAAGGDACLAAFTEVTVTVAPASDCDGNGTLDACDLADGTLADCDGDGIPDLCATEDGTATDADGDGEPDSCERARGDLDLDGTVGGSDLSLLLSMWGQVNPAFGDLDGDGVIGAGDLAFLLSRWTGPPPQLASISPADGPAEGGTEITITGVNLEGTTAVRVGTRRATGVVQVSPTAVRATVPAGEPGPAVVSVTTASGTASLANGFTFISNLVVPTVTAVTPNQGVTTGGTAITVTGTGFAGAATVKVGTANATGVTVVNATTITAVTPAGTAGAKSVSVTTSGGTGSKANAFTYFEPPLITSIVPGAGPTAGGTAIAINGRGFTGVTSVTIGGLAATSFTVASPTKINAVTPAHSAGAKTVTVSGPWGTASQAGGYTYFAPPTVSSIAPNQGLTSGGTLVMITGTNFTGATSVTIGGVAATSVTIQNATTILALTPVGLAGPRTVSVTSPGGTGSLPNGFTYFAPPTLTSVVPGAGPTAGGQSISINGTGLTGVTSVSIGGVAATSFTVASATKINAVTPPHSTGAKTVTVSGPWGTASLASGYTYHPAPTVLSVSPNFGPTAGGTSITVTGTDFVAGGTTVKIGTKSATGVSVVNSTTLNATTPADSAGAKTVSVTTPGGTGTKASAFTYFAPPAITTIVPSQGTTLGGTAIAINGSGLLGVTSVTIGGIPATSFTVASATKINAVTPPHSAGAKTVTVSGLWGTASKASGYTYVPPPTVASVSPNQGPTAGGTSITVTGTNFTGATSVKIGTKSATGVSVVNSTTITATTPADSAGAKTVSVTTPGGTGSLPNGFTVVAPPSISSVSPSQGSTAGGQSITINGSGFAGATSVSIGGVPVSSFTVVSATMINATTPPHSAGAKTVSVSGPWGTGSKANAYTYLLLPIVTSVSPDHGRTTGGTLITISGQNFTGATLVKIGNSAATSVTVQNSTTILAVTPAGTPGPKLVTVTTPIGPGALANGFRYFSVPAWATLLEAMPDPAVVTDASLRQRIVDSNLAWRVKHTQTQIEMLLVPPGTFNMGCSASNQQGCQSNENPVHAVTLTNAFYLGRYEVTQAQWTAVTGSNPSWVNSATAEVPADQVPLRPVEFVSRNMINGFNTATGLRLPTEAEWEYAYRAGTTTAFHSFSGYPNGTNDDSLLGNIGWFDPEAAGQTRPVGQKQANALGLHDMSGNVAEFTNDVYSLTYYQTSPSTDPQGPEPPPEGPYHHAVRGFGGRASTRIGFTFNGVIHDFVGFRAAKSP